MRDGETTDEHRERVIALIMAIAGPIAAVVILVCDGTIAFGS